MKNIQLGTLLSCLLVVVMHLPLSAQTNQVSLSFTVSMNDPASQRYHVTFNCEGISADTIEFKMPVWMPGFYQILDYANYVENFSATTDSGKQLQWLKSSKNGWKVATDKANSIKLTYNVKATTPGVIGNFLDETHGYIAPTGLFVYPSGYLKHAISVKIEPYHEWKNVATGLDKIENDPFRFFAPDYDVLYDCPILIGNLESFPSFSVKSIPHYFVAYTTDSFDRAMLMRDLEKMIIVASDIIGDIPYKHYTFLGTGLGGGGVEHLNSTAVTFKGGELNIHERKIATYNFLAHEYFHHYNVKRIRPIELGPFDYDNGNRTNMLWLSEGVTVYYEYIMLKRAGITTKKEFINELQTSIKAYESKPGRYFQTPAEASYSTWEEGPFGRVGDSVNKTISPYDKGPILGMLLDLKIRHATKNKKCMDDLMRKLYNEYYKKLNRGFTEQEFRKECESLAGVSLADYFDYIYTLKQVDYPTYLNYAGLKIDTVARALPNGWLGANVRERNDTLWVTNVDWKSPAWNAGIRSRKAILEVNGKKVTAKDFKTMLASSQIGDAIKIRFTTSAGEKEETIQLRKKMEASYHISEVENPSTLQLAILKGWLGDR